MGIETWRLGEFNGIVPVLNINTRKFRMYTHRFDIITVHLNSKFAIEVGVVFCNRFGHEL